MIKITSPQYIKIQYCLILKLYMNNVKAKVRNCL